MLTLSPVVDPVLELPALGSVTVQLVNTADHSSALYAAPSASLGAKVSQSCRRLARPRPLKSILMRHVVAESPPVSFADVAGVKYRFVFLWSS